MLFVRRFVSVVALATVFLTSLSAQAPQQSSNQPTPQQQPKSQPKCADNGTYVNSRGRQSSVPRTARQRLKVQPRNAMTEVTASATPDAAHVRITAVSPNGCNSLSTVLRKSPLASPTPQCLGCGRCLPARMYAA